MGPIWGPKNPGGPHVGPMNFAIWVIIVTSHKCHTISNHQQIDSLFNRFFCWQQRKHESSLLQALCDRNPQITSGFPSQRASNAESFSMSSCYPVPSGCWENLVHKWLCHIIALWGWFSRDMLPVTCCKHGPPSIATVHFSKFSIATNISLN